MSAERGEEEIQQLKAELFLLVVAGKEDLAVLVELVNQTFDGVRGRTHRREDSGSTWGVKSEGIGQKPKGKAADRAEG
jgi:hypothetical protein